MKNFVILLFCFVYSFLSAQNPSQDRVELTWQEANDLFNKGLYSTAQEKFREYQSFNSIHSNTFLSQKQEASWLETLCAFHLLREDAEDRLQAFIDLEKENQHQTEAAYYLAKLKFIKKDYTALEEQIAAIESSSLEENQVLELKFMQGYLAFKNKNYAQAAPLLSECTENEEFGADAAFFGAQANYYQADYEKAVNLFLKAEKTELYQSKVSIWLAKSYIELKKDAELINLAQAIKSVEHPAEQKSDILLMTANYFYESNKPEQSLIYFELFIAGKNTSDRAVQYRLAQTYLQLGKLSEASTHFQQLMLSQDSISQVSAYHLAFIQLKQNKSEDARLSFQKASGLDFKPEIKQDAHFQFAKLSVQNKYYPEAKNSIESFLNKYPQAKNTEEARSLLAEVYLYTENYAEAIKHFENSKHTDKRSKISYQKACYLHAGNLAKAGKIDEAIILYRKSENVNIDPQTSLLSKYWLAETFFKAHRFQEAQDAYQSFCQTYPAKNHELYSYAMLGQAWCSFYEKKYAEAGNLFKKAAQVIPKKEKDLYTEAYLRWGDCHFIRKEYAAALEPYQKIVDTGTKDKDYALFQLGITESRLGNYKKSAALLEKLADQYEQSTLHDEALDQLSEIYLTWLTDYAKGADFARVLIQKHPQSPLKASAYTHLGIAAYNSKDEEAAVKNFKIVVFEYGESEKQVKVALDALNSILPDTEFEQIFAQYKEKYPAVNKALDELAFNMGRDKFQDNEFAKALELLTQYLKDYPAGQFTAEALVLKGDAEHKLNKTEAALKDYEEVWTNHANSSASTVALDHASRIFVEKKQYEKAIELLEKVEKQAEKSSDKHKAMLAKSRVLQEKRDFVVAKMQLEQLLTEENLSEYTRFRSKLELGKVLFGMKKYKESSDLLEEVEQNADDGTGVEAQYYLSKLFLEQKDFEQSKSAVLYLKENYPTFNEWKGKAFLILAEAYVGLKQKVQAVETLKSLVSNSPNDQIKTEASARMKVLEAEIAKEEAESEEEEEEEQEEKKKEEPKIEEKKTKEKPVQEVKKKPTTTVNKPKPSNKPTQNTNTKPKPTNKPKN